MIDESYFLSRAEGCQTSDFKYWFSRFLEASDITNDSREVRSNSVFIAVKGRRFDGHDFIEDLLSKNDSLIVANKQFLQENPSLRLNKRILFVDDARAFTKEIGPIFFGEPSKKMRVIGITGTNGKTTTSYFLEALYKSAGKKVGLIGTVNVRIGDEVFNSAHTTPDVIDLQRILSKMQKKGVEVVIMEVSSHALYLGRVHGLHFDSVIWTSFTQDHMDFHKTMEDYFRAKLLIFDYLSQSVKKNKNAIVFNEMEEVDKIKNYCRSFAFSLQTYGSPRKGANLSGEALNLSRDGMDVKVQEKGGLEENLFFNKVGSFNLYNSMASFLEFRLYLGENAPSLKSAYDVLNGVSIPGRLEKVDNPLSALIVVDYAHTPDALENVLKTVKEIPHERIICVFGCGGNRDVQKRPLMGGIAERYADIVVVTSDNPRKEDPNEIIKMILEGMKKKTYFVESDRRLAIFFALQQVKKGDILLIAGKGHEDYQIIGEKKIHFDDKEVVKSFFS